MVLCVGGAWCEYLSREREVAHRVLTFYMERVKSE